MVLEPDPTATRAELIPVDLGWYFLLSSTGAAARPQFVERGIIGDAIDHDNLDDESRVIEYFEAELRRLSYRPRRNDGGMIPGAIAAWDLGG